MTELEELKLAYEECSRQRNELLNKLKAQQQEPLFWYRPCSNGMYEGPIHNAQIERVRKESGAWHPLYTSPQPAQQQEIEELTTQRDKLADILTRTANVLKGQPAREHIGDSGRVLIQPIGPVVCHQPAAQTDECVVCGDKVRVIPRPWVGLTKEDRYKAIRPLYCDDATAALAACHSNDEYEAIEAKLREKNNG